MDDKNFILADNEGNYIAVISKKGKGSPSEFNAAIELAVKEHFCAEKAIINRVEDAMEFSVETIEDEDENLRDFTLEEITVY